MTSVKDTKEFLPVSTINLLKKQGYYLFGHSAVKTCHYTKQALRSKKTCYKQKFYGIQSHQCIQMSPASAFCDQKCIYCWRPVNTFSPRLKSLSSKTTAFDSPKEIVEESIIGQKTQLSGFGGFEDVNKEKLEESKLPKHAAISLTGEPTLYPLLPGLITAYHKKGISTFVVSNGLHPEILKKLVKNPPTQLYLSVDSPKKEIHDKLNRPVFPDSWKKLNTSIELLQKITSRTVIRITCVKGYNMNFAKEFAGLIKKGKPDFVEVKGYVHIGFSQYRLPRNCMPSFKEVKEFAQELAEQLGYYYKMDDKESLVCLLVRPDWKDKSTIIPFRKLFPKSFEEQDLHMQKWKERIAKEKK